MRVCPARAPAGCRASPGAGAHDDHVRFELERRGQLASIADVPAAFGRLVVRVGAAAQNHFGEIGHGVVSFALGATTGTGLATFLGGPGYPVAAAFSGMRYQALMVSRMTAA